MRAVALTGGGYVFVSRVPRSFHRPHCYHFQHHTMWVMRSDSLTTDMTYEQLRTAFDRGATLAERAARFAGRMQIAREENKTAIASLTISGFIRDGIYKFLDVARRFGVGGHAIAGVSLLNVAGWEWCFQAAGQIPESKASDRSRLTLPEMWIEQLGVISNPDEVIRPILDTLWQAFDLEQCMF